jgi:hypothetical protein
LKEVTSPALIFLSWISLAVALACALAIAIHLALGGRQRMWIMNVVWPVTALWAGPIALWAYWRYGRAGSARAAEDARRRGAPAPNREQPFAVLVAKGATHCGSGCTLGDIAAELFTLALPLAIFGQRLFGSWIYDFAAAYVLGIAFQYFTIKPMRQVSAGKGLIEAIKADTLSLMAWQVGMYGWMAIVRFAIVGRDLPKDRPVFWFMMQIGMVFGFATAYPVNWWLLRRKIKEAM